jgi:Tol biopolymer transport system component
MDDWNTEYNTFGHNFEIYIINIRTKKLERLTTNTTFDSFPVFSNDGKQLVFASNRNVENPRQTNIFKADINN